MKKRKAWLVVVYAIRCGLTPPSREKKDEAATKISTSFNLVVLFPLSYSSFPFLSFFLNEILSNNPEELDRPTPTREFFLDIRGRNPLLLSLRWTFVFTMIFFNSSKLLPWSHPSLSPLTSFNSLRARTQTYTHTHVQARLSCSSNDKVFVEQDLFLFFLSNIFESYHYFYFVCYFFLLRVCFIFLFFFPNQFKNFDFW